MKVYGTLDSVDRAASVVTVGSYDGVHFGHRVLLDEVVRHAGSIGGRSVVVTFWPHPRQVLPRGGEVRLLSSLDEKLFLLADAGIDATVVVPFDERFAAMSYTDFVTDILVGRIGMKHMVVGYNHRFGRGQGGDFASLGALQAGLGFSAEMVEKRQLGDDRVSSTAVRERIAAGDMAGAARLLTRGYIVIGDLDGERLRIPEAAKLLPPPGKYGVTVRAAAGNIGYIGSARTGSFCTAGAGQEVCPAGVAAPAEVTCGPLAATAGVAAYLVVADGGKVFVCLPDGADGVLPRGRVMAVFD